MYPDPITYTVAARNSYLADAIWLAAILIVFSLALLLGKFTLRNWLTFVAVVTCVIGAAIRLAFVADQLVSAPISPIPF